MLRQPRTHFDIFLNNLAGLALNIQILRRHDVSRIEWSPFIRDSIKACRENRQKAGI